MADWNFDKIPADRRAKVLTLHRSGSYGDLARLFLAWGVFSAGCDCMGADAVRAWIRFWIQTELLADD